MAKMGLSVIGALGLVGCAQVQGVQETYQEPTQITYWVDGRSQGMSVLASYENDSVLEEALGISIKFITPEPNQSEQAFKLLMASRKNLPDVVETNWLTAYPGGPERAIKSGIIKDLTPYLSEYAPYYQEQIASDDERLKESKTDSGAIYGFHAIKPPNQRILGGFMIREDWLRELGFKIPETIKEWEVVLMALKTQKNCLYPLSITLNELINHMIPAYGISQGFYLKGGKVQYGAIQPEYKDFLVTMNRWYESGLIDPSFAAIDEQTVKSNLLREKSGATFGNWQVAKENELGLVAVPFPTLEKGQALEVLPATYGGRIGKQTAAITGRSSHIEVVMKWFDEQYRQQTFEQQALDIEGLEIFNQNIMDIPSNRLPPIVATPSEDKELVELLGEIERYMMEKTIGFIMGVEPLDRFDEFVAHIKELGIQRAVDIKQVGVDRYNNR